MKIRGLHFLLLMLLIITSITTQASKLVYVKVVDKDMLMLYFKDGDAEFNEENKGYNASLPSDKMDVNYYGNQLNTNNATNTSSYSIKSSEDANFGSAGKTPTKINRRSKICAMVQKDWNNMGTNDWNYDYAFEHSIFLQLPSSLQQGKEYTITINSNTNSDKTTYQFTYNIFTTKSESIKVNVVGYDESDAVKSADLYMWLGDGGSRNFSSTVGNKVYLYDVNSSTKIEVGTVKLWKPEAGEFTHNHKSIRSNVWNVDFTGFNTPGTYRLAVEGVGCSDEFEIKGDIYYEPFKVATQGFYYMRIGAKHENMTPLPRKPYYIPGEDNFKVVVTTMHRWHPEWKNFSSGDAWDKPADWIKFATNRQSNVKGGHSDAKDWDRYLGHAASLYDLLLPYIITNGAIADDDLGIYESGNGVPDVIDEAKDEVDLWLSCRDGKGYSGGVTNANENIMYQAANTGNAAWCNALNAAMLSNAYMISGHTALMEEYKDSAVNAWNYASSLSKADQMLDAVEMGFTGQDFRVSAAAFLYNITGDTKYEDALASGTRVTGSNSSIYDTQGNKFNELYSIVGYLFTSRPVNYTTLWNNMKSSVIAEAKKNEAIYSQSRPSRRSSDQYNSWFQTTIGTQRTIIAHAIADEGADKNLFRDALYLEADWTLGRNPLNMIHMTTATTNLETERSVENAYTSGWNDGTPGVHPGHTPYMGVNNWGDGMVQEKPETLFDMGYPVKDNWPLAEQYINTRFVFAHCEFTPQQTMRGKSALYGYLYALAPSCEKPNLGKDVSICGQSSITLDAQLDAAGRTFSWEKDDEAIAGTSNTLKITEAGIYKVTTNEAGCIKSDQINVLGVLPAVDLGADLEICDPISFDLEIAAKGKGITYSWEKDGVLISGEEEATLNVSKAGTYTGIISASGCPDKSDEIIVTSNLLDVTGGKICAAGELTLTVNTPDGVYEWYDDAVAGTLLYTGSSYTPTISESTTYYVKDISGISGSLGKTVTDGDTTWNVGGDGISANDKLTKLTILQNVTLQSVSIYLGSAGDVTINIKEGETVVHTATVKDVAAGLQPIPLNFNLTPGSYTMDLAGTTVQVKFEASGATFPYSYPDYISFENNVSWAATWYGYFYDWKIFSGNPCARTPVKAIINPNGEGCGTATTQTIDLEEGWNLISINVNPDVKTIETIFAGLDIEMVKNADGFWKKDQAAPLNSLSSIIPGNGYLVYANSAETLIVTAAEMPEATPTTKAGWNLIGCPFQTATDLETLWNSSNTTTVKDFEGFWEPNGSLNSIDKLEPGKGYYLFGK